MMSRIIVLLALIVCLSSPVFAFGGTTHTRVTKEAIRKVRISLPEDQLLRGSVLPDEVENGLDRSKLYFGHFYDPLLDFALQQNDNALTRMEYHFRQAEEAYKRRKFSDAGLELGQSLHYVQDMCCPVHTWGYDFNRGWMRFFMHLAYEDSVDDLKSYLFPDYTPHNTDVRETAIYWSKTGFNRPFAKRLREYAGKGESAYGWFAKFATWGGYNPINIVGNPLRTRFSLCKDVSSELDIPMMASCDLIYQFCQRTGEPFTLHPSSGRVTF